MTTTTPPPSALARFAQALAHEGRGRHGMQLAVAVVAAYAVSAALGLPESLWAVMSALIVVRPNTGTTLSAGWTRLAGTVLGSLGGFAGVWLRHHGAGLPSVTLVVVAALAFASAVVPLFASAPIAALIILSSTAMPGHSALQVAGLRGIEVGIGVATGVLVSLIGRGAGGTRRFERALETLLHRFAALLQPGSEVSADAETAIRTRLRELAVLAAGADTEARWLHRARGDARRRHRRLAGLTARVFQDVAVIARLLATRGAAGDASRAVALQALERAAAAIAGREAFSPPATAGTDGALVAPLKLLIGELAALSRGAANAQADGR